MKRYLLVSFVVTGLGLPLAANAEESGGESPPEFVERARALFQMGVELSDQEEYEQAARRFEQALGLHDATTIRFNLASVYVLLERRTEAAQQLEILIAAENIAPELRTQAEGLFSGLRSELGRLRISLDEPDTIVEVSLDDRVLTAGQMARPLWVEPGSHIITATRGGIHVARQHVEVESGGLSEVDLALAISAEEAADEGSLEGAARGDEEGGRRRRRRGARDYRIWVGVGVGIALVVAAVAVGVSLGTREPEVEPPVVGNFGPGVLEWR